MKHWDTGAEVSCRLQRCLVGCRGVMWAAEVSCGLQRCLVGCRGVVGCRGASVYPLFTSAFVQ